MKHTPGPWVITKDRGVHYKIVGDSTEICKVRKVWDSYTPFYNAYLISAAPELLEALEAMLDEYDVQQGHMGTYTKAIEAIAKAKGEIR